jgi:hypothetical protein
LPNLVVKVALFISSYSPLLVILWVRSLFLPTASVSLLILAAASITGLLFYLRLARTFSTFGVTIKSANGCSQEAISYIVTYLLPFLDLNSASVADRVSLGLVLVVVSVLYINANLIHMNPVLNLLGYRILEAEGSDDKHFMLLSRRTYLPPGSSIRAVSLTNDILLEVQ